MKIIQLIEIMAFIEDGVYASQMEYWNDGRME
jgi:hypothetical protein